MSRVHPFWFLAFAVVIANLNPAIAADVGKSPAEIALERAVDGECREAKNRMRDRYRHPLQTLRFFDVRPDQTVLEITPGAGWYSEILAPLLMREGEFRAAVYYPRDRRGPNPLAEQLWDKFARDQACFGKAKWVEFDLVAPVLGDADSVDVVLSFRNVHNWEQGGHAEQMFRAIFDVLKPGGMFGVVDHRAAEHMAEQSVVGTGYIAVERVKRLAWQAGFVLDGESGVNANVLDTKDYKAGVWTLPPTLVSGNENRERYLSIGESDRMTLRFRKPRR